MYQEKISNLIICDENHNPITNLKIADISGDIRVGIYFALLNVMRDSSYKLSFSIFDDNNKNIYFSEISTDTVNPPIPNNVDYFIPEYSFTAILENAAPGTFHLVCVLTHGGATYDSAQTYFQIEKVSNDDHQ